MELQSYFQVRLATEEDIPAIMDITKEAFTKYVELAGLQSVSALTETYEDVKRDLETKLVLIAVQDDVPVGSVRLEIRDDHTAYLSRFGVRTTNQNSGIGKSIMHLADRLMLKHGVKQIHLHTCSTVFSLIRFYYGRGFYIDSTDKSRGYVRALLIKDYDRTPVLDTKIF